MKNTSNFQEILTEYEATSDSLKRVLFYVGVARVLDRLLRSKRISTYMSDKIIASFELSEDERIAWVNISMAKIKWD
ncbi:MAG: hypothetical protein ACRBG0_21510 [Lewinella sp.]|uniref:hypothetical protein n=1 Tax=Lewinella sp. TaxID=2004506 RepID=UPI003D6A6BA0